MQFTRHSKLVGSHSILSASNCHWANDEDDDAFERRLHRMRAAQRGTELHELAQRLIKLRQELPPTGQTLNMYVNDAIGYGLIPEQPLFFSFNAYATADAIGFDIETNTLQCFDLKTGVNPGNPLQLFIYAAYFCLEYDVEPFDIKYDLRIYQNDAIGMIETYPENIALIKGRIKHYDAMIDRINEEGA